MKKVQLFSTMSEFENFINRTDIEVIQVDIKVVEQSCMFQEYFVAIVFYKELKNSSELFEIVNFEYEEITTEHNTKVVSSFMDHCKENGIEIPDSLFESYFDV